MAQNMTEYRGERLSFFKIFSQKNFKLVIPIIQRDYAQGRTNDDTKEVRTDFLDALYTYLKENRPNRDLDFVYGTLQKGDDEDERVHFIPLDGQQRLTTLFLLHWFLYQISDNIELKSMFKDKLLDGDKSQFTYETRQSSIDFCDALMKANVDMFNLITIKDKQGHDVPSLSATLKNEHWYYRIWNNDPTVQSMLVMLDAIYQKFDGKKEYFAGLMDEDNPIITFIFMDLKEYKLTDDLYIKMNSRGKPLSKFENFKAKFEQYIKVLLNNDASLKNKKYKINYSSTETEVDLYKYFSYNIDTKWTTLFWQYCKNGKAQNLDSYIENFIRVILTCHYASTVELAPKATSDETLDVLMSSDSDYKSLTFNKYEGTKALSLDAVLSLVDSLDALYNGKNGIKHYVSEDYKFYFDEDDIFKKVIENNLTRNERIQFYAYIKFLVLNQCNGDGIDEWMRVIHNISHPDNSIIDGNDDMARGIRSVNTLLPYANDIINHLKNHSITGFATHQCAEECIKAQLIDRPIWKQSIENTEKHPYFNGQIGFILQFSGICDDYQQNHELRWSEQEEKDKLHLFKRYAQIASYMFDLDANGIRYNDKNYCFERAILVQGDYLMEASNDRFNLLSTETVAKNVKRDHSWKRLLRINETREELIKSQNYVKSAFDKVSDMNDITGSFENQCEDVKTGSQWRDLLITTPELYEISEKGFMAFDEDQLLILRYWFRNSYHVELYTYHLWLNKLENNLMEFSPLFELNYMEQKTGDITPFIRLSGYTYKRNKYHIDIQSSIKESDWSLETFWVSFAFDNEKRTDYPDDLLEIFNELKFTRSEVDNSYEWTSSSENSVFKKLKEIIKRLLEL